jgi:hypothetical protein
MYRESMIQVARISNGFILEVRAPYKRKEKDEEAKDRCCCISVGMGYGEKEIFAKDAADLGKKIEMLMPLLDEEFASESEFDAAFKVVK